MSRERLARDADVSTSTVANVERGQRCGDELAGRIAAVLGCEPEQLFERLSVRYAPASVDA